MSKSILDSHSDLKTLCKIVYERNDICRRRTSIRNKLYRLESKSKTASTGKHLLDLRYQMSRITQEQYAFTKRTHETLRSILRDYGLFLERARYYNRIDAVVIDDVRYDKQILEEMAIDFIFEEEVLCS